MSTGYDLFCTTFVHSNQFNAFLVVSVGLEQLHYYYCFRSGVWLHLLSLLKLKTTIGGDLFSSILFHV